jgi:hypothetical protein
MVGCISMFEMAFICNATLGRIIQRTGSATQTATYVFGDLPLFGCSSSATLHVFAGSGLEDSLSCPRRAGRHGIQ